MTTANNDLLHYFFEDVHETMASIEERLQLLKQAPDYAQAEPQMQALGVLTHRLRGTASLYGFPQMAQLASVAERLLMPRPQLPESWQGRYNDLVSEIVVALSGAAKEAKTTGQEGNLGLTFAQTGAPQRMTELLRAHPDAFYLARGHLRGGFETEGHTPATPEGVAPTQQSSTEDISDDLSRQLLTFAQDNAEVWEYFAPEVQEHLDALHAGLGSDEPDIHVLFRSAHTIKGSSYMVGLQPLGEFAHRMEDLLGAIRDGQQELDGPVTETLEQSADAMGLMLRAAGGEAQSLDAQVSRLSRRLQLLAGGNDWTEVVARETQYAAQASTEQTTSAPSSAAQEQRSNLETELALFGRENAEVLEYFAPEVQEHLDALRTQLERADAADINEMFRSAHTIKGSSYMVGLQPLGDFAHRAEDLLGAVRDGAQALDGPVLETLDQATDAMGQMLAMTQGQAGSAQDAHVLAERLRLLSQGRSWESVLEAERTSAITVDTPDQAEPGTPALLPVRTSVRVDTRRLEELMDQIGDLVVARARLEQSLQTFSGLQNALDQSQARFSRTVRDFEERYLNPDMVTDRATVTGRGVVGDTDLGEQFDELELDTYNDLNILARSMTELAADFSEVRSRFENGLRSLQEDNEDLAKLTRRLRLDLSRTSRVPFTSVAGRLRRWARERSERLELHINGETTEVDTAVLQQLAEPLLHLLNNAASHGISSPEQRLAAGKPALGQVSLRVTEGGNFLEVSVQDDGEGLNYDAIRIRALEKGLRSAQELEQMSQGDLARLILLPGLSTAKTVSSEAGRGVGMDVVANTLRGMGGELLIHSEPGQGTVFTMRIPTNQRIADLLTCQVGGQEIAFSVNTVRLLMERERQDLITGEHGLEVELDSARLPVIDLRQIWGMTGEDSTYRLVILSAAAGDIAVRVDAFGDIDEAAVGNLGSVLAQMDYLSGTAISPSGQPMPILDPTGLGRLMRRREMWLRKGAQEDSAAQRARVMLVDDSLSVRRLVSRMLERGGYDVTTANDGQEAWTACKWTTHPSTW
ncbi:Hpt domain-containing protein [Deinococcus radiophilus]|uniref:Hpt domain-containing protein n=1 Tax=Deinococcus radiophilus TaxID=32062 RepID=UPI003608DB68